MLSHRSAFPEKQRLEIPALACWLLYFAIVNSKNSSYDITLVIFTSVQLKSKHDMEQNAEFHFYTVQLTIAFQLIELYPTTF